MRLPQHRLQLPEPDVLRIPPQITIQERDLLSLASLLLVQKHQVDPGRLERRVKIDGVQQLAIGAGVVATVLKREREVQRREPTVGLHFGSAPREFTSLFQLPALQSDRDQ